MRRLLLAISFIAVSAWAGWWLLGRPPEREMLEAQTALIKALEKRSWSKVSKALSETYTDSWGQNRELAVELGKQALSGFISLGIHEQLLSSRAAEGVGETTFHLQLDGNGMGFSSVVLGRVNSMNQPWKLNWRKEGLWPWTWKVVRLEQPDVVLPPQ